MDVSQRCPLSTTSLSLPSEIIELIAQKLFDFCSTSNSSQDVCSTKHPWCQVQGFLSASPELHHMGYRYWMEVLHIRQQEDWDEALKFSTFVRELRCADGVFKVNHRAVLARFPRLYAVVIDCHSDVKTDTRGRFAYRNVFTDLPRSLRRLEIQHSHGPDINIISTVKMYCPDLQELRLGRCTMFNRTPACKFWQTFPFDHNSYISDERTDEYTHSLGQELAPLRKLTAIRLGVYLMPSDLVLGHRIFHLRGQVAPDGIGWQQALQLAAGPQSEDEEVPHSPQVQDLVSLLHRPLESEDGFSAHSCPLCYEQSYERTRRAEESANNILKQVIPSLERSEWMSWFTPNHLGVSVHRYASVAPFHVPE